MDLVDGRLEKLTPRQRQIVELIAAGETNKAIARRFGLAEATVRNYVADILHRLDVPSRAAAAALWSLQQGRRDLHG